jgi:hypothetical protein
MPPPFAVQDGDAPEVNLYIVDRSGNVTVIGTLTVQGQLVAAGAGSTLTTSGDVVAGRHFLASSGTAPGAAAGASAGTGPPAPIVTAGSNDTRGSLTFGTGTTPAAGAQAVVTFATAFAAAPVVMLTPTTALAAALNPYVSPVSTTAFTIAAQTAPAASQAAGTYGVAWAVIG